METRAPPTVPVLTRILDQTTGCTAKLYKAPRTQVDDGKPEQAISHDSELKRKLLQLSDGVPKGDTWNTTDQGNSTDPDLGSDPVIEFHDLELDSKAVEAFLEAEYDSKGNETAS